MNYNDLIAACENLGVKAPYSFEPDGKVWTGTDDDRKYEDDRAIYAEAERIANARAAAIESARKKLSDVGLSAEEISAVFGF
jgi:hypothetical protein